MKNLTILAILLLGTQSLATNSFPLEQQNPVLILPKSGNYTVSVFFSPNGQNMVTQSLDTLRVWDLKTGKASSRIVWYGGISFAAYSPDGTTLAIRGLEAQKLVKLWKITPGRLITLSGVPPNYDQNQGITTLWGHVDDVNSVVFSPDSKLLATGSDDKTIKLWDAKTGECLKTLLGHTDHVNSVAFSPDGKLFASGSGTYYDYSKETRDFSVRLWDVETGQLLKTLTSHSDVVRTVSFSPDGNTVASLSDKQVTLWNARSGKQVATFPLVKSLTFSPDGKLVALTIRRVPSELSDGNDWSIKIWDIEARKGHQTIQDVSFDPTTFSPDGRTIAAIRGSTLELWDVKTGTELKTLGGRANKSIAYSPDGQLIAAIADLNLVTLWDLSSGNELVSIVSSRNAWVVVTPDQRFDTENMELSGLTWMFRDRSTSLLPIEIFMREYYEPDLLRKVLSRESLPILRPTSQLNRVQPLVNSLQVTATNADGSVDVSVEVEDVRATKSRNNIEETLSSGVYDLRLFRDEQLVGQSPPQQSLDRFVSDAPHLSTRESEERVVSVQAWREANDLAKVVRFENAKAIYTFKGIKLPHYKRQQVKFSAYAFNADRVKSQTISSYYRIPYNPNLPPEPRRAYVITFGGNKYDSPEGNLQYAGNDARAMQEIISARLRLRKEFDEVVDISLISDDEIIDGKVVQRRDFTKENVRAIFGLLGGIALTETALKKLEKAVGTSVLKRIHRTNPEDFVLISFSAHGFADQSGIFYIQPTDITKGVNQRITRGLLRSFISSEELSNWLRDVDAGDMVMIIDACYAAAAVEGKDFKPAPMGSRGLGQLAFDKGMRILTATQAADFAVESGGSVRHGLLTYALLREGIEKGEADFRVTDGEIRLKEWLEFGEFRVPKLYEDIVTGKVKSIKTRQARAGDVTVIQQPSLFDFTREKPEITLVSLK